MDHLVGLEEHLDFHYSSDAEWDYAGARQIGSFHPERAWISSDRDVWYANPFYTGLPVPHPEDDAACEAFHADPEAWRAAEKARRDAPLPTYDAWEEIPF